MLDKHIRAALIATHLSKHGTETECKIVPEMGVCIDDSRIDIAVINGHFHGYEIKSDHDTLKRVETQLGDYSKVFDYLTFVVGVRHTENLVRSIPKWCGVLEAVEKNNTVHFRGVQKATKNKDTDALSIAQLLWKDECVFILKQFGATRLSGKNKMQLWEEIATVIPKNKLSRIVRTTLKARATWKVHQPLFPSDGCLQPSAT